LFFVFAFSLITFFAVRTAPPVTTKESNMFTTKKKIIQVVGDALRRGTSKDVGYYAGKRGGWIAVSAYDKVLEAKIDELTKDYEALKERFDWLLKDLEIVRATDIGWDKYKPKADDGILPNTRKISDLAKSVNAIRKFLGIKFNSESAKYTCEKEKPSK